MNISMPSPGKPQAMPTPIILRMTGISLHNFAIRCQCENRLLNTLHLEQILLKLNLLEIVRKKAQTLVPLLEAQVVEETVTLRSALVLHPSWLAQGLEPGEDAIIRLKRNEQELAQDAALFVELCGRAKKDTLQSLIAAILEVKQQDIARLARPREMPI